MNDQPARDLHAGSVVMPGGLQVGSGDDRPACSDQAGTLWIVAGPRRARSEEHVLAAARTLGPCVSAFRAGLWDSGGVGAAGLPWLRRVRDEVGLRTAVEVGGADHVEACLRHGIDILGVDLQTIGARSIQDIADALRGVHVPVLVGNPAEPDVRSWVAALERLGHASGRVLIGVHQGFAADDGSHYRRSPDWGVVAELRRVMPHLPVICNPSQIAGAGHLVAEVAHRAVEMRAMGLVIATSESAEAVLQEHEITSAQLHRLLAQLMPGGDPGRASGSGVSLVRNAAILIDELRQQIDAVDVSLLYALAQRMSLVQQIGRHKKAASITTVQIDRWMKLVEHRLALGRKLDLSGDFVLALFELIHKEAIHVQDDLLPSVPEGVSQS